MEVTDKQASYGELQCYSSQRCRARIIAGDKNLFENNLDADLTIYTVSKYLCVDMTICDSYKYFVLIYTIGQSQPMLTSI